MNERLQYLLSLIVDEYTTTAQPVGSKAIAERGKLDVSSATIRNDMAELEERGYIFQPHTSAGRVPTEKGYTYYVENFIKSDVAPTKAQQQQLAKSAAAYSVYQPEAIKAIAKTVAELADSAVFVGFGQMNVYYTGISNLFSQPEFSQQNLVQSMSQVIDHLDQVMVNLFTDSTDQLQILLGNRNPFGRDCGTVIVRYQAKKNIGMIGILGPVRMDYQRNVSVLRHAGELINQYT